MEIPIEEYLSLLLESTAENSGEVLQTIPELARVDPDRFAIAFATPDGEVYAAGDATTEFTIQSISKPFTYALAIADRGIEDVLDHIDVEPSGDAFNEISLEPATDRPRNPMINAGAIAAHALVDGGDADERSRRIVAFYSALAGRELEVDEQVHASELEQANRNLAIAYMLKTVGKLDGDPPAVVGGYTRQCSVRVTVKDLARMAGVLASGGRAPDGTRLIDPQVNRQVLSVMTTCGMYDAAGDWLTTVGIPAKSGVSGAVLGVLPGQLGIAAFSPRLDEHGHSVRGVRAFERLSQHMGLHLMDTTQVPESMARRHCVDDVWVHEISGDLRFAEVERVMRSFQCEPQGDSPVVLDLTRVHHVNDIARRVLVEGIRRLHADGHEVRLVDPTSVLDDAGGGGFLRSELSEDRFRPRRFPDVSSAVAG